ncbi:hypothetical protein FG379_000305 [Cryptosporidium bovis]|uniref:uncharacterized protein n=1 Tax=Cryptosporidium bovis TaxID=310047 RepID=UPI00351A9868|nr:hypothetical protein FG379_000305 [Cryptosporidium bovis]
MDSFFSKIDLLGSNFDASLAIQNLDVVRFPKNTHALDNLAKAKLLLPFGVQERINKDSSNINELETKNSEKEKLSDSIAIDVNSLKNIDYKFLKKKKFIESKDVYFSAIKKFTGLKGDQIIRQKVMVIPKNKTEQVSYDIHINYLYY